jgi:hypothetical protein
MPFGDNVFGAAPGDPDWRTTACDETIMMAGGRNARNGSMFKYNVDIYRATNRIA